MEEIFGMDLPQWNRYMTLVKKAVTENPTGKNEADLLFLPLHLTWKVLAEKLLKDAKKSNEYNTLTAQASATLRGWKENDPLHREPNYTSQGLVDAQLSKKAAVEVSREWNKTLRLLDTYHLASIQERMQTTGLADAMKRHGKGIDTVDGKCKLAVWEIQSRITPALTFEGSSAYFSTGIVPYGMDIQNAVREPLPKGMSFASLDAAKHNATWLQNAFGVKHHYVLAESSIAPRPDVPKSGRSPEVFIVGFAGKRILEAHYEIETPFREAFNACVRENMFSALRSLYRV